MKWWFNKKKYCDHVHTHEYTHTNMDGVVDNHAIWCDDCGKTLMGKRPKEPTFYVGGDM